MITGLADARKKRQAAAQNAENSQAGSGTKPEIKPLTINENPEVNAKMEAFKKENPDLVERLKVTPKEVLERKYLLQKMRQAEGRKTSQSEAQAFINDPANAPKVAEMKSYISEKLPIVVQERRLTAMVKNHLRKGQGIKA